MRDQIQSPADASFATIDVQQLGLRDYAATRAAMIAFTAARDEGTRDALWLLEHPPVYTLGLAGRPQHLHGPVDIPVVRTERGGQVTYHGPGQLVVYLLIDLKRRGIRVRAFVRLIEEAVVATLAAYNSSGRTKPGAPGVYVEFEGDLQKIAAIGLKIDRHGRTFHGLSLNVAMDLAPYAAIDACGFPGLKSIDLAGLGVAAHVGRVGERLAATLVERIEDASH